MINLEASLLMQKAKTVGLTYEEKAKLHLLIAFKPKCRSYTNGDKCRCDACKDYADSVNCES